MCVLYYMQLLTVLTCIFGFICERASLIQEINLCIVLHLTFKSSLKISYVLPPTHFILKYQSNFSMVRYHFLWRAAFTILLLLCCLAMFQAFICLSIFRLFLLALPMVVCQNYLKLSILHAQWVRP